MYFKNIMLCVYKYYGKNIVWKGYREWEDVEMWW